MAAEAPAPTFCNPEELKALTAAFKSAKVAASFCERLAPASGAASSETVEAMAEGINTFFLTINGALVFIMHAGFAMLCAGAIRSKNTMNILLQTILDAAVSALAWYLVGYGLAWGDTTRGNAFLGTDGYAMSNWPSVVGPSAATGRWSDWFFQWAFAATATTIPAGCVAERFNFSAYLAYTAWISAWVYPIVVHWCWAPRGWLSAFNTTNPLLGSGMIDFAGCGVVHMVGGIAGLVACILVGPRLGRFDSDGKPVDMPGHSATLVVLGTCLLWFGWYGFNPGSTLNIVSGTSAATSANLFLTSGRAAVCTTLSGAAGVLTALVISFVRHKSWDLVNVCNGALVGFVSITAGAAVLEPWAALIAGCVGMLIFEGTCALWLKLRIDDPLCASPMHGICGMWGLLVTGFLANPTYVGQAYLNGKFGAFYPGGGGHLLACQVIGILVITGWVVAMMAPLFLILKALRRLRITPEEEQAGLDVSKHGGSAYNHDGAMVKGGLM
jgi:Amt family ammonium transporter